MLTATVDGHDVSWERIAEPGSGDAITACTAVDGVSYAVDGNGNAFREMARNRSAGPGNHDGQANTLADGSTARKSDEKVDAGWTQIGVEAADEVFHDIVSDGERTFATGNEGCVYRYDDGADNWTPLAVTDATIEAVALDGDTIVSVDQSKHVHRRTVGDEQWQSRRLPMDEQPTDLVVGTTDVGGGDSGFVVRRENGTAET